MRHFRETNSASPAMRENAQRTDPDVPPPTDWIKLARSQQHSAYSPPRLNGSPSCTSTRALLAGPRPSTRAAGHLVDLAAFHCDVNPAARHADLSLPLPPTAAHIPARAAGPARPHVMATGLAPILASHVVAGYPICLAPVYIAVDLALARCIVHLAPRDARAPSGARRRLALNTHGAGAPPSPSHAGKVYASMHVQACAEAPVLDALKRRAGTSVLDVRGHTVVYGPRCQALRRMWVAEAVVRRGRGCPPPPPRRLRWSLSQRVCAECRPC